MPLCVSRGRNSEVQEHKGNARYQQNAHENYCYTAVGIVHLNNFTLGWWHKILDIKLGLNLRFLKGKAETWGHIDKNVLSILLGGIYYSLLFWCFFSNMTILLLTIET